MTKLKPNAYQYCAFMIPVANWNTALETSSAIDSRSSRLGRRRDGRPRPQPRDHRPQLRQQQRDRREADVDVQALRAPRRGTSGRWASGTAAAGRRPPARSRSRAGSARRRRATGSPVTITIETSTSSSEPSADVSHGPRSGERQNVGRNGPGRRLHGRRRTAIQRRFDGQQARVLEARREPRAARSRRRRRAPRRTTR